MEPDRTDLLALILAAYSLVLPVVLAMAAAFVLAYAVLRWLAGG